jgi:hypothetical protein
MLVKNIASFSMILGLFMLTACNSDSQKQGINSSSIAPIESTRINTQTYPGTYMDNSVWDDIKRDQGIDIREEMQEIMRQSNNSTSSTTGNKPDSTDDMIRNSERLRIQENAHLDYIEKMREQSQRKAKSFCVSDPETCS